MYRGTTVTSSAQPLRLVLLADRPEWREQLQLALVSLPGAYTLHVVADWPAAHAALAEAGPSLLLVTLGWRPESGRFPWPSVLLLDEEVAESPEASSTG